MLDKDKLSEIDSRAKKFSALISLPMMMEGRRIKVGTSIGISSYPKDGDNIDHLMEVADQKMYQDKSHKHNSVKRMAS
ncbi:MAG TPA: diguanylate cyclase [Leucothrix sp.]|nr:diguanylate cyclase [Leucothrix sp.]